MEEVSKVLGPKSRNLVKSIKNMYNSNQITNLNQISLLPHQRFILEKEHDVSNIDTGSSPKVHLQIIDSMKQDDANSISSEANSEIPTFLNKNQQLNHFLKPTLFLEKRAELNNE